MKIIMCEHNRSIESEFDCAVCECADIKVQLELSDRQERKEAKLRARLIEAAARIYSLHSGSHYTDDEISKFMKALLAE